MRKKIFLIVIFLIFQEVLSFGDNKIDSIDQKQTEGNDYKKIYGDVWLAQSFIPREDKITRIKLKIGKIDNKLIKFSRLFLFLCKINAIPYKLNKIGDLIISIRKRLDGEDLASISISFNEIRNEWTEIDFEDIPAYENITQTYYIICHAQGGSEKECYIWAYSDVDVYDNGTAFFSLDGINWKCNKSQDFCFITFGKDREADGVTNYWGLLIGIEEYKEMPPAMYAVRDVDSIFNSLSSNGWQKDHILTLINEEATRDNIIISMRWIDMKEDEDDIILFLFSGWGKKDAIICYDNIIFTANEINKEINKMGSSSILIILESWYSGSLIDELSFPGRIILTSASENEKSWRYSMLKSSVFIYYLSKAFEGYADEPRNGGDGNKIVTAEEAFNYASYLTSIFEKPQHPQIYDGYKGEMPITFVE